MKKFFIITVLAIASFSSSNAQVTWNIRVGGGLIEYDYSSYSSLVGWYDYSHEYEGAFVLALESNIPFKRGKAFCLSPSVIGAIGGDTQEFIFPLLVGYKLKLSQKSLLIPKVGLNVVSFNYYGGDYNDHSVDVGPSVALSFEHKHFIMGFNGCFNVVEDVGSSYLLTLGYKF